MDRGKRLLALVSAVAVLVVVLNGCDQSRAPLPPAAGVETTVLERRLDEVLDRLQNVENALDELENRLEEIQSDLEDLKLHLDVP